MHSHSDSKKSARRTIAGMCLFLWLILDVVLWKFAFATHAIKAPELYFLNVGQGDSELILLPGPRGKQSVSILIDGGTGGQVLEELQKVLPSNERTIDIVLMTNPDLDHFGGLVNVLSDYNVRLFIGSGRKKDGERYEGLMQAIKAHDVPYLALREGDAIRYGDALFSVISPSPEEFAGKTVNNSSIVGMFTYRDFRALYSADIGPEVEQRLVQDYDLAANVLKVPHHGSKFSSTQAFVNEVNPAVSIIEVGKNSYGHPTKEALDRLGRVSGHIFRTDTDGTMRILLGGETMAIHRVP